MMCSSLNSRIQVQATQLSWAEAKLGASLVSGLCMSLSYCLALSREYIMSRTPLLPRAEQKYASALATVLSMLWLILRHG